MAVILNHMWGERKKQGLAIGQYESAYLANLFAYELFVKANNHSHQRIYHIIYQYNSLVVFRVNKKIQ